MNTKVNFEKLQWIICISGFLDLFAVAMLYPLLVHRAKDLGATPSQVGLFGSVYGALQFFSSPLMGQLSDHIGRRAVLLMSLLGTAFGYFCIGLSNSIILLALARIPSGIFKHSQSMSRTYLADITPRQQRASIFGTFNSMSSIGFIVGPVVGGLISTTENGFFKVATLASCIFAFNALFVCCFVPTLEDVLECLKDELEFKDTVRKNLTKNDESFNILFSFNAIRDFKLIPWHTIWDVFTIRFLMSFSSILFRSNFTSILVYRFDTTAVMNGYITSFNGVVSAVAGALVRYIAPRFGSDATLSCTFSVVTVFSLLLITLAPSIGIVIAGIVPLCISSAILRVTNSSSIYNKSKDEVRGLVNGLGDTLTSLARAMGPTIAGYAQEYSIYGPGVCGTLLAIAGTSMEFYSIFKHSLSVNRILLSDITLREDRARVIGSFNSFSNLGFIIGPTVGGLLYTTENGFFWCAMSASFLFVVNGCLVYHMMPDTQTNFNKESNTKKMRLSEWLPLINFLSDFRLIPWSLVWDVFTVRFLLSFAVISFRCTSSTFLLYKFNTSPSTIGYITSFNGLINAISGITIRWISPLFKTNAAFHNCFAIILVFSLFFITFVNSLTGFICILIPLCLSTSTLRITNAIHLYDAGNVKAKGLLSGFRDTITSVSRICGPLLAGYAEEVSMYGPGVVSVILAAFGTVVGFHIKPYKIRKD